MRLRLSEETASCLTAYELVPISFEVAERLEINSDAGRTAGFTWRTRTARPPYLKDYDAIPGNRPSDWARRWDLSKWCFAAAFQGSRRVGGAAVIIDATEVDVSAAEEGAAVLWDIRVHPEFRRQGVGRRLIEFAEGIARACGRRRMRAETQDVNVAACRLYARAGYSLREVRPLAYPDFPDETQLIWEKDLASGVPQGLRRPK